jgi:hypothetical protein
VDEDGAVGGDPRDEPAAHEVDDERREARLDDVPADAPDDGLSQLARAAHARGDLADGLHGQDVRERREEVAQAGVFAERPREVLDRDLARPRRQRVGAHAFEPERLYVFVDGQVTPPSVVG